MRRLGMSVGISVAVLVMFAGSALADAGGLPSVPDGGSTAMLVAASMFGLNLCRKLFR